MRIVELILDEQQMASGIDAISIVEAPAIESNFVALKSHEVKFAKIDAEKRILMGPILIPDKPIYRKQIVDGELDEFYIYFSKQTVAKASQMYLMNSKQSNTTLEHGMELNGLCLVETWLKEDMEKDKSAIYGMTDPIGTWMGSLKVTNNDVWENYVKTGKVKGFSIEGYFADKMKMSKTPSVLDEVRELLNEYKKSNTNKK